MLTIIPGDPGRLGVTAHEGGYNFALFSQHAEAVELCLYTADGSTEVARLMLTERAGSVWHGFVPSLEAPFAYGYRVHGPWSPNRGHRFNPNKLLFDPYARDIVGSFSWHPAAYGDARDKQGHSTGERCPLDSGPWVPKGLVRRPDICYPKPCTVATPWSQTLVWEAHVRGTTLLHPNVPEQDRGRFRGLAAPAVIDHLKAHGVSAVELMPVQSVISEHHLYQRNLVNFWGYNPLGWFAFNPDFAHSDPRAEFCWMVNQFHDAGIEVILDIVYNHTCESDSLGPTLCYRGIDNAAYYRLMPDDPQHYVNDTGCGNTLNADHPMVRRLIIDNLSWLASLGVDGFRFDLGVTLGRSNEGFSRDAPLWQAIRETPMLSNRRLFTEPWDIGPGGYQLGRMPAEMVEWNDRFRDDVRRAWRGDANSLGALARRLHGSADIFEPHGRPPHCSLNYIASHDGASLADLVAYTRKHNEANGEQNRDGHHDNLAQNFGVEGATDDPDILALRGRTLRSQLATVLLAQGTPMITAGDEFGHSRGGNNNAYCQDNELNWLDWRQWEQDAFGLRKVVQTLMSLRKSYPAIWQDGWRHQQAHGRSDGIDWLHPDGHEMTVVDWENSNLHGVMMRVIADQGRQDLLLCINTALASGCFQLPAPGHWHRVLDTAVVDSAVADVHRETLQGKIGIAAGEETELLSRSIQVFLSFGAESAVR